MLMNWSFSPIVRADIIFSSVAFSSSDLNQLTAHTAVVAIVCRYCKGSCSCFFGLHDILLSPRSYLGTSDLILRSWL